MKNFFFRSIYFIIVLLAIPIYSLDKINLTEDCDDIAKCHIRPWYVVDSFSEEYLQMQSPGSSWKKVTEFPLFPETYFPETKSILFSIYTRFDAPKEYLSKTSNPGIYLSSIGEVFTIYLNGEIIAQEGKSENGKIVFSRYGRYRLFPINSSLLKEKDNLLVLKVEGTPGFWANGIYTGNSVYIDDYTEVSLNIRDRAGYILVFLYLFVGAYHLFLYFKRRAEVYNLYFALLSVVIFTYMLNQKGAFLEYGIDSVLGYKLELISGYLIYPLMICFLESLFFGRISRFIKFLSAFFVLLALLTAVFSPPELNAFMRIWQTVILVGLFYAFYIFYTAIKQKSDNASKLLLGFTILIIFTIFDILDSMIFKTGFQFARYAFFAFVVGIAAILANRFLNLYETIEDLNSSLEKKVIQRTKELQQTLDQVKLLKEQQDGDYFLTTLIIAPLATNSARDERVEMDVLVRQKKKFEFRKKVHEIGGDICISDIISLKGKKYTVFINGDAMGKSIQGAGGAIVLGVVFKSIISRTQMYAQSQNIYPERWLKLAFIELQKVFESFDGSMLVSIVIGILDNDTGFLYFINAEHPWCVLYRDGKASFIEDEFKLRKVGMLGVDGSIQVQTYKMSDGDVIFIGSDGRDDLKLGEDDAGRRIINENENLFLQTVEEANAELEKILEATEKKGEITDDFSLLKVCYHGKKNTGMYDKPAFLSEANTLFSNEKFSEAFSVLEKNQNEELFQFAEEYALLVTNITDKLKNFNKGIEILKKYQEKHPEDEKAIYKLACYYFYSMQYDAAADIGERLKLRNPESLKVLHLLVEIYTVSGNKDRAVKIQIDIERLLPVSSRTAAAGTASGIR